ncbi:MAG: radical SAM protein [Desulfovibrio sp.]|nr:radical SAM protein [Desulfovibrio sp.]
MQDGTVLNTTESLCPECLKRIPARNVRCGDRVYLVKTCPEHGLFRTVVWRGEPAYESWGLSRRESAKKTFPAEHSGNCPFDCGPCRAHNSRPCAVLLEVTSRCNLNCPVCFADTRASATGADPPLQAIEGWYRALLAQGGPCNIQLSGGEPTVRDDLPEIIALGRKLGFDFIQLNSNGLRLGADRHYAQLLRDAGLGCAFLQFDGTGDEIYRRIRGEALLRRKEAAIKNCAEHGIGVALVSTLVPGVNTADIGNLVRYALRWVPYVRAVHFQPIGYIGRYPKTPRDDDRFTIPEIIRSLESQTGGMVRIENFLPPGGENVHCSFHANFVVLPDGSLKPWVSDSTAYFRDRAEYDGDGSARAREFMARQWRAPQTREPRNASRADEPEESSASLNAFLSRLETHTLSISGMAFQDAWNVDLERLRDCHIGIMSHDNRIIPFCAYNLTSRAGRTLYRTQDVIHERLQGHAGLRPLDSPKNRL